ncbi:unnamed protein product [Phytomonas sp. EM1]|nr:unnamed protein product [Phytomonas sp. EM1]|eukprot:CCW62672.1 unnamed protein product [Phytomonas sp. isolate EM1]
MSSSDIALKPKRMPPWMSMPGAPPRPDGSAFGSKIAPLLAEKQKCFDELKELQKAMEDSKRSDTDEEGKLMQERLKVIDDELRAQNTLRVGKNTEISKLRQQSRDANKELKALQSELGGLSNAKEIDLAIEQVMRKMETSGGGLSAEKRTLKRLQQLEEAKGLFFKVQTLTETIRDAEEREALLQQEYREIHQRIGTLNRELETNLQVKREKNKEAQASGTVRSEIYKKCLEVRARITAINKQINELRAEHNKVSETWNAWCDEARKKYNEKLQAELEERKRRQQERIDAAKSRRKEYLLKKRQHEHEVEISACVTLMEYLRDKRRVIREEEEEKAKLQAAADFDPVKVAPEGFAVLNEGKWTSHTSLSRSAKKQQKRQQKASQLNKPATQKPVHHPKEIVELFHRVGLEPPVSVADFDGSVVKIREKKNEFESIIVSEAELSSEDEPEAEKAPQQDSTECNDQANIGVKEEAHKEGDEVAASS